MVRRSRRGRASLNWLMGFQNRGPYSLQNLMSRRGAARANLQWRNRSMTRTQTRTRSRPGSGIGVTTQHDARFIYGKRRMPRGKRMRWKRFGNKVHAVAERDLGSRTVLRNQMELFANNTPGNHITGSYTLYGQRGTAGRHDDLQQIAGAENAGDPTAAAGVTVDPSTKFIFKSAVMDLTFKNDASYRGAVDPLILTPSGDLKIELDIYEISVRTGSEETGLTAANLETLFNQNNTITKAIGGGGSEIDYFTRGATPWDLTYVLGRWGIRIWKKTKYFLANQDVITYQVRDPRRRTATQRDLAQKDGFNRPGWTRCIFFIAKTVPGAWTIGTATNNVSERLLVGCTRKYLYKIEGVNEDRTRVI